MVVKKRNRSMLLLILSLPLLFSGFADAAIFDISTDQTTTVFAAGGDEVILHDISVDVTTGYGLLAQGVGAMISGSADVSSGTSGNHAVYANNNAAIVLERANILAAGSNSSGVSANNSASVTAAGIVNITGVTGVTALNGGTVNFGNALSVDAESRALRTIGSNSAINIGDDASIKVGITNNATALTRGIDAGGTNSEVRVGDRLNLETKGSSGGAAIYSNGGKIYISDDAKVTAHTTKGIESTAGGEVHIGNWLKLNAVDGSPYAVQALSGGKVYISDDAVISDGNYGLNTQNGGSYIYVGDRLKLDALSYGIETMSGSIEVGQRLDLNTGLIGVRAGLTSSRITISNDATITSGLYGLYSTDGGEIVVGRGLDLTVTDNRGLGVSAWYGGNVTLYGGNVTMENSNALAIYATGLPNIYQGATATVTGSGVFDITGDMYAGQLGSIDITMADGSRFMGGTLYVSSDTTSELSLTLNGATTEWDVTSGYSDLTNLYMNGSTVDMTYAGLGSEIFVVGLGESASDNGVFRMNADIADEFADHIYVGGLAQGTYRIDVVNDGSQATVGTELTDLVYVEPDQSVVFILDHIVEQGGFQYELRRPDQDTGTTFLTSRADHFENAWYLGGTGRASIPGSGAINSFAGSYLIAYADTQTLIQRMGDLRESPYGQGLWFRVHGGKFESNSKSYVRGFDMDYGGIQIGYDRKLENKWGGDLYTGIMFGYSKGDLDYSHEGSGEVDSMTAGIYGTYIARNGWYVDTILKYQWMTNDFDVIDTAGTLVRGQDVDTGGIGASVEIGKRIHVGDGKENKQGWYVEPQIQLSYQRQDGGYFNATNGLRIGVDSFNSLLGRVGILAGYETETTNLYAKVSKVKEFDGDLTIRANGVPISESFGDNWWVYGIGCTSRISDRNSLYFEIERTSGGSFSQPWRMFAGCRLEF